MKIKHIIFIASLVCAVTAARAASITWTVSTITDGASDISNVGTAVIAASGADGGTNANVVDGVTVATVNGVAFTDDFTLDSPSPLDTISNRANATGQYYEMLKLKEMRFSESI